MQATYDSRMASIYDAMCTSERSHKELVSKLVIDPVTYSFRMTDRDTTLIPQLVAVRLKIQQSARRNTNQSVYKAVQ